MRQHSTLDKQSSGKPITDSAAAMWIKGRLYHLMMLLTRTKVTCKVEMVNACTPLPDKPIIFVANHGAFPDTPIMLRAVNRHSYALLGKQNLAFIDWVFFMLSGVIWVDRKKKADMAAAKDGILAYLQKGQSILWFPEGTWNLTPNQLMLPMKWGVIDVAQQADAQIIPAALDYDRERMVCSVKFGSPMSGTDFENKAEAIHNLRDAMATLRWELMCDYPVLHRADISPEQLRKEMYQVIEEYPPLDWEYERSCIYHPYPSQEDVFRHLQNIHPSHKTAFLLRK